eukprot:CCRYP_017696-RA/>CCRYP_017696-RA protein AED:0.05 eAED:0.05 QI:44/1/1/1/0/0/2/246/107
MLPTTIGSGGYILGVTFDELIILTLLYSTHVKFFNEIVTGPVLKSPKLSPQTEFGISLCTAVFPTNFGRGVYINRGQAREQPKLSPQTEFGISRCTTVLPTMVCRGM